MKKTTLFFCISFLTGSMFAQTFVLGTSDAGNDATQALSPDAKAVYYAMDQSKDSLWFKLEFYKRVDKSAWNIKVGIDSNNNLTDGGIWAGANTSMKQDLLLDIYNNPGFPPAYGNILNGSGSYISSNIAITFADTNAVVLRLRLSEIKQTGKVLNFIAGTGLVVGTVNDDIPNSGYITIPANFSGIAVKHPLASISLFPNPADQVLYIKCSDKVLTDNLQYTLTDLKGCCLQTGNLSSDNFWLNVGSLHRGTYLLSLTGAGFHTVKKFIRE